MKLTTKLLKKLIKEEFASMGSGPGEVSPEEVIGDVEQSGQIGREIKDIMDKYNLSKDDIIALVTDESLTYKDEDSVWPPSDVPRI